MSNAVEVCLEIERETDDAYRVRVLQGHEGFSIPDDQVWEAYDRADEMHRRRL